MMNATEMRKVIQFNTTEDKNVWGVISTFLSRIGQNSNNTRMTYERAIRDFFLVMRNRELEKLVEEDLIFTKAQIEMYQVKLKEQSKSSTVNNRMSALKKCYTKLEDQFDVKASWFDVDRYEQSDKEGYDPMTFEEVLEAVELVRDTRKGTEKALFLEMAMVTAFRKESLRQIKFSDIYRHKDSWVVTVIGKGKKKSSKKITDDFYERIMAYKESGNKHNQDRIFFLTNQTIRGMMDYVRENIDFGNRNITFHSLKKASIKEKGRRTNYDLKAMQAQGDHSDITTTLNDYLAEKDIDDMEALDLYYQPPVDEFEKMSKEELIKMLKDAPRDVQMKLLHQQGIV